MTDKTVGSTDAPPQDAEMTARRRAGADGRRVEPVLTAGDGAEGPPRDKTPPAADAKPPRPAPKAAGDAAPPPPKKGAGGKPAPQKPGGAVALKEQPKRPAPQPAKKPPARGPLRATPLGRVIPIDRIRARPRPRHAMLIASFFALVLLPAMVVNWYLHAVASDQYASTLAFTIQSDQSVDAGGFFDVLAGGGAGADDAEVLYGFIRSQNLVETLEERLGLRERFNREGADWWFRLGDDPSIEHLVDYWEWMCVVTFDAGIVEVEVRAFDPDDAREIAQAVLDESTRQ
ncbi:MAG: hypothetical protein AAF322_06405, partial [Pseudomonadota bacterium]